MKRSAALIMMALSGCALSTDKHTPVKVAEIEKYKIELPAELIKASDGFHPGIGSGIEFKQKLSNGNLEFIAISDRGPNYPTGKGNEIIIFAPEFSPKIVKIEVAPKVSATVKEFTHIKYQKKYVTGLNINQNISDEEIYDKSLNKLKPTFGLDTESISILKNGDFVIGDEYYPSINIVNHKNGNIIRRLTPGNGLPAILKQRNFNRGFEAVTVAPNGKIYAILESVLNIDESSNKNAKLIRLMEIDLNNNSVKTYAYPFDYKAYSDSSKVKIGDITALDDNNFLLVEQGAGKDGTYHNLVYKINLSDATDISNIKLEDARELEHGNLVDLKAIKFIDKKIIFNPRDYGWKENKLEGLTIINANSIALTNDTDFAIDGYELVDKECKKHKGHIHKEATPIINKNNLDTDLWIITFANRL